VAATTPPRLLRRRQQTIHGDVHDPATFSTPLAGCEAACYLVHSLSDADFSATMWRRRSIRRSGGAGRPDSIIYLRRLDDADALPAHLRSRRQGEKLLGCGGVPVTALRAGSHRRARRHLVGAGRDSLLSTCP